MLAAGRRGGAAARTAPPQADALVLASCGTASAPADRAGPAEPRAVSEPRPRDAPSRRPQLGRDAAGDAAVAHRCPCGCPTSSRRRRGSTTARRSRRCYYLTCPRLASAIGTLESDGLMKEQTARLADDPELRGALRGGARATTSRRRDRLEVLRGRPARAGCPTA